jgi:hypothetical protein
LHLIELRKADRLRLAPALLAAWITLFEHWQEDDTMSQLTDKPVRAAFDKLKHLSADTEARRVRSAYPTDRMDRGQQDTPSCPAKHEELS